MVHHGVLVSEQNVTIFAQGKIWNIISDHKLIEKRFLYKFMRKFYKIPRRYSSEYWGIVWLLTMNLEDCFNATLTPDLLLNIQEVINKQLLFVEDLMSFHLGVADQMKFKHPLSGMRLSLHHITLLYHI